jgi:hypothetical protein
LDNDFKRTYAIRRAKKMLGCPPLELEVKDSEIENMCILPALIEYYNARPYEYRQEVAVCSGITWVDVPDLATILSLTQDRIFFVGVIYVEQSRSDYVTKSSLYPSRMIGIYDPLYNISGKLLPDVLLERQLYGSVENNIVSKAIYDYDPVANKVSISTGLMSAQIAIHFGYGFSVMDYILPGHLNIMGDLIAVELLEWIINARGAISLAGEIAISTSDLQNSLAVARDRASLGLESIRIPVMLRG